jgi:predicted acetyltransferase
MTEKLRRSRSGEEETLGKVGHAAFRTPGPPDGWARYFQDHAHRSPEDTWVCEIDGEIAGHATALRLDMRFDGVELPLRGVAAVAVRPDQRRRGVAGKLLRKMLGDMARAGDALTGLYAFSAPFYQAYGYGMAERLELARVSPSALPASPLRRGVRTLDRERDQKEMRAVYDRWCEGRRGPLRRGDYWWNDRVFARIPDGAVYRDAGGRLQGYLLYEIDPASHYPHFTCGVKELVTVTPDAKRGLLGFLEALGEQFRVVELTAAREELSILLTRYGTGDGPPPSRAFEQATHLCVGMMGRILRVPEALALHPGTKRLTGSLGLDLTDPVLRDVAGAWDVELSRDGAKAKKAKRIGDRLAMSIDQLSSCYFGGARALGLHAAGMIEGSRKAAALLDRAFAGPPLFLGRPNYF